MLTGTAAESATPAAEASRADENRAWLEALRGEGSAHDDAVARLHALLVRAARFELRRRARVLAHLRRDDIEDLALQTADDALVAVLARLDSFRGASRFTTWAYKFALLDAAVTARRLAWQGREVPLEPERWSVVAAHGLRPDAAAEQSELLQALAGAVTHGLTPHQRAILVAITLDDVPIDVLAERLGTTRGAIYKTLHDARQALRRRLAEDGFDVRGAVDGD